jgi:LuxR family maltose regulon positive regulatory protein
VGLALILYEWNRLEETRPPLQGVIHDAVVWQHVALQTWSYRILAVVELAAGDLVAAHQALQEAERIAQQIGSMTHQSWVRSVRVRWWLAVGDLTRAGDWAAHVIFRQDAWEPHRAEELLALIRVYLARQQFAQAIETLERFSTHLDRPGDMAITIEFLSLSVVSLHQAGMSVQARTVAARLLALTEPEGHIRVYLDAGEAMKQILQSFLDAPQDEEHGSSTVSGSYVLTLLAAFEQEEIKHTLRIDGSPVRPQEQEALPQLPPLLPGPTSSAPAPMEPLTPQEQRVLRLLAEGLSNQEIAQALIVSLNTVKTHVKNLYSKLHVNSRTQASALARDLQLL